MAPVLLWQTRLWRALSGADISQVRLFQYFSFYLNFVPFYFSPSFEVIIDVGAHEWSRFLPELRADPRAWLVLVEPGRAARGLETILWRNLDVLGSKKLVASRLFLSFTDASRPENCFLIFFYSLRVYAIPVRTFSLAFLGEVDYADVLSRVVALPVALSWEPGWHLVWLDASTASAPLILSCFRIDLGLSISAHQ